MLKLTNIIKDYQVGNTYERAIKGISTSFTKGEFVAFLGPSGSGKTTLLNIIGGLDHYTSGDLLINGKSTKDFKDSDWDTYRNNNVGFVFQNHYLINHLSILENVELAMTLNGKTPEYRRARALFLLNEVGLSDFVHKRPPYLSGGQKQRVAIARALANDPDIILADEPTGSLDSENSIIVMELIKKISQNKLVIVVTHNQELAFQYATRILRMKDGKIIEDTINVIHEPTEQIYKNHPSKMSFKSALKISFKNLKMRIFRTILTAFAGSIGIIGVGLVFSGSAALENITESLQTNSLSGLPISINPTTTRVDSPLVPDSNDDINYSKIYPYDTASVVTHVNNLSTEYLDYLGQLDPDQYRHIYYYYGLKMNMVSYNSSLGTYSTTSALNFGPIPTSMDNVAIQYDLLYGDFPSQPSDIVLVIDDTNIVDVRILRYLGLPTDRLIDFNEVIGKSVHIAKNDDYYVKNSTTHKYSVSSNLSQAYNNGFILNVCGVIRRKPDVWSALFSDYGVYYTQEFVTMALANANQSQIVSDQKVSSTNVISGSSATVTNNLIALGAQTSPIGLMIYTSTFEQTRQIVTYLNAWNKGKSTENRIVFRNSASSMMASLEDIVATTNVSILVFALMTIIVSGSMIGIITFISVFERTKEIGILRAIGARKQDIARIFNSETLLIGIFAGIMGLFFSYGLCSIINVIGRNFYAYLPNIAHLNWWQSILLITCSVVLSFVSGYLPARHAAKKDPVVALSSAN